MWKFKPFQSCACFCFETAFWQSWQVGWPQHCVWICPSRVISSLVRISVPSVGWIIKSYQRCPRYKNTVQVQKLFHRDPSLVVCRRMAPEEPRETLRVSKSFHLPQCFTAASLIFQWWAWVNWAGAASSPIENALSRAYLSPVLV
jgi:hypothetical protein